MPADKHDLPQKKDLVEAVEALQKAAKAQDAAQSLREKASTITDSKQREQIIRDAYDKEIEAHGQSKLARRLQSGTWQGLAGGTGIGAGVGVSVGTVVGIVTGGLVSLPTTALGALIGSGVGAVHGPWIKLGGKDRKLADVPAEELVDASVREGDDGQDTVPATAQAVHSMTAKKQPRKLEIRSSQGNDIAEKTESEVRVRDTSRKPKPRKLEVRRPLEHDSR